MKHIVMTIAVLVIASVCAMAQNTNTKPYEKEGKVFVESKSTSSLPYKGDKVTDYTWRDSKGVEYPIILHTYVKGEKKGKVGAYVIRTSKKTGNEYPHWLPQEVVDEILKAEE